MGFEYANRLAGLNQKGLVILQILETCDDGMIALPVPGGLSGTAIDDKFLRFLRHLLV